MNPEGSRIRYDDLDRQNFAILDIETTGLNPESGDRIIELAAIKIRKGKKTNQLHHLINPKRPLSEEAYRINQIDEDMLKGAPTIDVVLPAVLDFIKGSVLCIYNAAFDINFLNKELLLIGQRIQEDAFILDVLVMARRLLPGLAGYSLKNVGAHLGIEVSVLHRALEDVEVTSKIFLYLLDILKQKGMHRLEDIHNLFGFNSRMINIANTIKTASILQAIKLERNLKIRYFSRSSSQISEREVKPREILKEKNKDYLIGHCCLRNEERHFSIDAILHLEIL